MSKTLYGCDGCDFATTDLADLTKVGRIKAGVYCETCAKKAQNYLQAMEGLRVSFTVRWADESAKIRRQFDLGVLPDA